MSSPHFKAVTDTWLSDLQSNAEINLRDEPNFWASDPSKLITTSQPVHFSIGTGSHILSSAFATCASTNHELIIVTCFWAKSHSQEDLASLLLKLSAKAISQNRKIQVRLCFSSLSLLQKLFQTSSLDGKIYPPSSWAGLGLPRPEELTGLDLVVKSVFVRPFSVMHPKFILVDRKIAFMPSCNVSWEDWFEGCIEMQGDIALKLFDFWTAFWGRGGSALPPISTTNASSEFPTLNGQDSSLIKQASFTQDTLLTQTILLPSPHHANRILHPFSTSTPPPTPLNTFILRILATATKSIFIQSPNLTCSPLISDLFSALERGIDVDLITSSRLMILEQLVTAGTITEFEVWKLRRRYARLLKVYNNSLKNPDLENPPVKPGVLKVGYFRKREGGGKDEPVKSHLKMVVVDGEITVLGSGNMDRASWFTSQELGVAFLGREVAERIKGAVDEGLEGRVVYVC
ncbi:hypothetical protein L207DRAFT_533046 [Hyaloscypha variabilis F]|jgi:phosphatidylserine/phosphatidylglycerophosphate/cardiolipin synthase-like enzyme|uniref:PLD phosphodiesterase domain-containing protein n=1 Tax=Hyaloscypha variabilis (strain UAMH 11265 / GT02V1 / F) TaxID=1149755 RepID=A0A2J6RCD8_HYAVF|nr:hypothetical protein L207DRAFT_533046 [Hyaloscypha variabilis F]